MTPSFLTPPPRLPKKEEKKHNQKAHDSSKPQTISQSKITSTHCSHDLHTVKSHKDRNASTDTSVNGRSLQGPLLAIFVSFRQNNITEQTAFTSISLFAALQ